MNKSTRATLTYPNGSKVEWEIKMDAEINYQNDRKIAFFTSDNKDVTLILGDTSDFMAITTLA